MRRFGREARAAQNAAKKRGRYGRLMRVSSIHVRAVAGSRKSTRIGTSSSSLVMSSPSRREAIEAVGASAATALLERGAVDGRERAVVAPLQHASVARAGDRDRAARLPRCRQWTIVAAAGLAEIGARAKQLLERRAGELLRELEADEAHVPR